MMYAILGTFLGLTALPILYHVYNALCYVCQTWRNGKQLDKLPGLPKHWLYGNLHQLPPRDSPETIAFFKEQTLRYPKVNRIWISPLLSWVSVNHPETMREFIKSSEPKCMDKSSVYSLLLPWLGEGLLISHGENWFRKRRLLTPGFHFDILKGYMDVFNESADTLMSKLASSSEDSNSVEIFEPVSLSTLDSILRCAFSYDIDVQRLGKKHPYVVAVLEMSKLLVGRAFNPLVRGSDFLFYLTSDGRSMRRHCNYVHKVAEDIIAERRKALEEEEADVMKAKKYLDFMDILLTARDENGLGLSDIEMRNEVDTFLFEGHDTTASGISWILHTLAMHPHIQDKARQEVEHVMNGRRDLKWDDLSKLPYLTLCIKEAMRICPPVPIIVRQLSKPMTVPGTEVTLLPGTLVELNIYCLHHNPTVWGEDCDEFKPERFEADNFQKMDPYAYCPFSAGPRNCIGQNFAMNEIKVVAAKALLRFEMSLDEKHETGPVPELVLRANNGIKLYFKSI